MVLCLVWGKIGFPDADRKGGSYTRTAAPKNCRWTLIALQSPACEYRTLVLFNQAVGGLLRLFTDITCAAVERPPNRTWTSPQLFMIATQLCIASPNRTAMQLTTKRRLNGHSHHSLIWSYLCKKWFIDSKCPISHMLDSPACSSSLSYHRGYTPKLDARLRHPFLRTHCWVITSLKEPF